MLSTDIQLECLDGPEGCQGQIEYRMALSPSGRQFPRCDHHWLKRLDFQKETKEKYPDTPCAPAWFDPTYAGERWDEDD